MRLPPGSRLHRPLLRALGLAVPLSGIALFPAAGGAAAQDEPRFAVSAGAYDIIRGDRSAEVGFEYRWPKVFWDLTPNAGVVANTDGGFYVFGGVRYDWNFAGRWIAAPHFAVTLLEHGDGRDLGTPVEFRSGLEVAYRLRERHRIGLSFYHLSNGGLSEVNPGSESLVLVWSF
jgi:hypothetical protein